MGGFNKLLKEGTATLNLSQEQKQNSLIIIQLQFYQSINIMPQSPLLELTIW